MKPYRIAIIAHQLRYAGGLSVGLNLIPSLIESLNDHHILLIVPEGCGYEGKITRQPNVQIVPVPKLAPLPRLWFDHSRLAALLGSFRASAVLALGNFGLDRPRAPQAIHCFDPHLFYPEDYYPSELYRRKLLKRYLRTRFRQQLSSTQLVFVQTQVAAERVRKFYGYQGKIAVIPPAVSADAEIGLNEPKKHPIPVDDQTLRLFCLTRYYPHKNLEILVEAFEHFSDRLADTLLILTIDTNQHPHAKRLLKYIERKRLAPRITSVGPLAQKDLATYYDWAHALILPTTLESFSSSYIEAMRFGTPILTSDLDFARAVCGPAAIYFDPRNSESVVQAIEGVRNSQRRVSLVTEGRRQLAKHHASWRQLGERMALEFMTLLTET